MARDSFYGEIIAHSLEAVCEELDSIVNSATGDDPELNQVIARLDRYSHSLKRIIKSQGNS